MSSLSFPDINVWLALALIDHVHHEPAWRSWAEDLSDDIVFSRFTQIGLLRLLTTSSVMLGKPLSMTTAWAVNDNLMEDPRVALTAEPSGVEPLFRRFTGSRLASPKLWADAYLLAYAKALRATLITFDSTLARRAENSLLLA